VSARILVVEDNPTNLDLISYLLQAFGYEVSCETDGAAGLKTALDGHFDLVLTDILMPNMDGLEFARRFKTDTRAAGTALVAVTALAMSGDRERILESGFDGYIAKPIDPQKFAAQISALLNTESRG
jgi:two-component system cell cycle response regulator